MIWELGMTVKRLAETVVIYTIQVFKKHAKPRKRALRYTPNEMVALDWMDLVCAKVLSISSPQIILPDRKRQNSSDSVHKSDLFKCIDLAQRAKVYWHQ